MSTSDAFLLARASFKAQALVTAHPPRLTHANKRVVYDLACPPGARHGGELVVSRWRAMPLPDAIPGGNGPALIVREDVFGYEPTPPSDPPTVEWHLNFADVNLFTGYAGPLFAQDEMQVAEHPALASLREALKAGGDPALRPSTRDGDAPTPVLIRGVERRVAIDVDHAAAMPYGLYGNRFSRATPEVIRKATLVLDPPTISNILAIEAIPGGYGRYSPAQISDVAVTAFTGFTAARIESRLGTGHEAPCVVVHTGHWGTGAYGGNKVLMACLQMLAARLAGLPRLVFHTVDEAGSAAFREAQAALEGLLAAHRTTEGLLGAVADMGFTWGVSDGN
jgi:hypothetical protein